ncbi:MAG: hypothetical protein DRP62_08140 [Planctomycetota bacterium]|nr:MAG: hypothetical protein DRP62_08140 [Planctomycetota bacterium]
MQKLIIILTVTALFMGAARRIEAVELVPVVDLYAEPAAGTSVNVNDTFTLAIMARFSEQGSWCATEIVFEWDPTYLRLDGETESPLFNESDWLSHEINDTWLDGDAGYKATNYDIPITMDTRVVTLNFTALAPVSSTTFNIALNAVAYPSEPTTVVLDAIALEDCHGGLYGANIEIVPEPATIAVLSFGGLLFLHPRK